MVLNGTRTDTEARANHFVWMTFDKKHEDFSLAACQPLQPRLNSITLRTPLLQVTQSDDGIADNFENIFGIERFFDEMQSASTHRLNGHRHVGLTGHKNEDRLYSPVRQSLLKREPVHAWQKNVNQSTDRSFPLERGKKLFSCRKNSPLYACRVQQHR
jgi:hypothetical protein